MLTFAHPGILWLLPLAAVPVVLHLLSRLILRTLSFPGMRFLRPSPMPLRGKRHWQDVLLMILRCLLIACAVLLASGIRWQAPETPQVTGECGVCAILDNSASMGAVIDGMQAQAFALPEETHYVGGTRDDWKTGYSAMNPQTALAEASNWLLKYPSTGRKLHIFSDLQASDWGSGFSALPEGTQIVIHTPMEYVPRNCGFTGVSVEALTQGRVRIMVRFRNWGDEAAERKITLALDGREETYEVTVQPNSAGVLPILVDSLQDSKGVLKMSPQDRYSFDDEWHFWARGEAPHPVLAILPPGEDEELAEELDAYFVPALTAEPDDAPAKYEVSVLDSVGAEDAVFSDLSAIYLLGASERLSPEMLSRIRQFVAEGGVLFAIPGNSPVVGWNALQANGLAPAVGKPLLEKRPTGIGVLPENSPLASLFPEKASSDLHLLNLRRWLRVETEPGDAILLKTLDGAPALIQHAVGKGSVYLFTFGSHREASDFATSKSFLPMLRELSDKSLAGHSETLRFSCGDPLPERRDITGQVIRAEASADTSVPGVWTYGSRLVEVNPPPGESIPQFIPEDEVLRALQECTLAETQGKTEDPDAPTLLIWYLALAFCGMLLLEGVLSLHGKVLRKSVQ